MKQTFLLYVALFATMLLACSKKDTLGTDQNSGRMNAPVSFEQTPYTYLQNKYANLLLEYEFKKKGDDYSADNYLLDEKLQIINALDSIKCSDEKTDETAQDAAFYENLSKNLMIEINKHPFVKNFIAQFALQDDYDENEMVFSTGSGCNDIVSKFYLLQCYEYGFDVVQQFIDIANLKGDEEFDDVKKSFVIQKAVRYTLHSRWGSTINYHFQSNTPNSVQTGVISAMADWRSASNNKISFSKITKKVNWNLFCWDMGWKYFPRIGKGNGNYAGQSTLGNVPWSNMKFNTANNPNERTYRHEMGHNLGLDHEHQRPDRDNYIIYHSNNVKSGQGHNFSKMTAGSYNYYGSTFDFNSIMLYYSFAFAKKGDTGKPEDATILKKEGGTIFNVSSNISETDKNVIRQIYNY